MGSLFSCWEIGGSSSKKFGLFYEGEVPLQAAGALLFFVNHNGQIKEHKMVVHNQERLEIKEELNEETELILTSQGKKRYILST